MKNFEYRRDRFESFSKYDNPLVNLSMRVTLPDFRPFCQARALPPFHFLLYCVLTSIRSIDNFMYRIHDGEVIRIDEFYASYTVINQDNNLNYALFDMSDDLDEFVARSLQAGKIAANTRALMNYGENLTPRQMKNNFYITCMPWLDLCAIEHPIYRHASADIPCIAWGKFGPPEGGNMTLPLAVQAHHGFVDGYHIHLLTQALAARIRQLIA